MARDTYLVNGVDLRSVFSRIERHPGLQDSPEILDQSVKVAGNNGALRRPGPPRYDVGTITFHLGLLGVDLDTGRRPTDPTDMSAWNRALGAAHRIFTGPLDLRHPRSDGDRIARAYRTGAITPVLERSRTKYGHIEVTCHIPSSWWRGVTEHTITPTGPLLTGGVLDLSVLADSDAPIPDAIIRPGPGNNPRLVHGAAFVGYRGIVPAARELVIDCGSWQTLPGAGGSWPGGDPREEQIERGLPGGPWIEIDIGWHGPTASLVHTGGGRMDISLTARPAYQTS